MTTPVLDRLLTRTVDAPAPAGDLVLRFERDAGNSAFTTTPGEWARESGDTIVFSIVDLDNTDTTELVIPAGLEVTLALADLPVVTGIIDVATTYETFGFIAGHRIRFTDDVVETAFSREVLILTFPGLSVDATLSVSKKVWCQLRDFSARDTLETRTSLGSVAVTERRFIVRASDAFRIADTFEFEGASYDVQGVSELRGRERYQEVLARVIGV